MKEVGKIAEELCIEAEKLGLCHPTERMIEEMLGSIFSQYETQISFLADDLKALRANHKLLLAFLNYAEDRVGYTDAYEAVRAEARKVKAQLKETR